MFKRLVVALLSVSLLVGIISCFAHSGDTDGISGHYDSTTGEYHYHHGEPAHQHKNGNCPYEPSDFSIIFGKILFWIGGLLTFPFIVNMIIGGLIAEFWDWILKKFNRPKQPPEEQLLLDEKSDKIYCFFSIMLSIFVVIIWTIIVCRW